MRNQKFHIWKSWPIHTHGRTSHTIKRQIEMISQIDLKWNPRLRAYIVNMYYKMILCNFLEKLSSRFRDIQENVPQVRNSYPPGKNFYAFPYSPLLKKIFPSTK